MKENQHIRELFIECFSYDKITGRLFWKARPREHFASERGFNRARKNVGKEAGYLKVRSGGHKQIHVGVNHKLYLAHRIIWMIEYGYFPEEIDHINGDGSDNRLDNLREANRLLNNRNSKIRSDNTSGCVGVEVVGGKFKANIGVGARGKRKCLGTFDTLFDACCARKSFENILGYHHNHGRRDEAR